MKKTFLSLFIAFTFLSSFAQTELPKGTASGTNTYVATISGGPATLKDGAQIILKLTNANTNTSTLNLNSLGAKAIKLNGTALASGDLPANVYMLFTYNASASSWQVSKPGAPAISTGQWNLTGNVLGADTKWLGSSDNFNVGFKTNNTVRETILKGGEHIWGPGTTLSGSETYSFQGGDIYVDDNFLVNNALTTSTRTLFGGDWVYGDNYGAQYVARSLVDKNYVDSSFAANPVEITVGTTAIASGTSGAIPFNGAGVYQEDATQLFWDNTNNRLGIGTATPQSLLTVGTIASNLNSNFYSFGYGAASTSGSNIRVGTLAQSNDANPFVLYLNAVGNAAAASRQMILQTGNDGVDNLGNLMLQPNGGVVGIGGTIYSAEKLNVAGHIAIDKADGALYLNDLDGGGRKFSLQSFDARFRIYDNTASLERMTIEDGGDIGISIDNPTARLHVKGSTSDASADGLVVEKLDGTDVLVVQNDGNVGIGTASPSDVFEVAVPSTGFPSMVINRAGANEFSIMRFQLAGVNKWAIGSGAQNASGHEFAIYDYVLGSSPLYISSTGMTGFGDAFDAGLWTIGSRSQNHRALILTTATAAQTSVIGFAHNNNTTNLTWTIGSDVTGAGGSTHEFGIVDQVNSRTALLLTNSGNIILPAIHNNSVSPTGVVPMVASGTYTATITDSANTSARTAYRSTWTRVGNVVHVAGVVDVDPTTTLTTTIIKISLPIASNFSIVGECRGTATSEAIAGQSASILETTAYAVSDFAIMKWACVDVTNQPMSYEFQYEVK